MNKNYFLVLIYILPLCSFGQNWCPIGATWHYGYDNNWTTEGVYKIEYIGDTTINSIQCKKLLKSTYNFHVLFLNSDTSIVGTEYTYSDSNKVYIYRHNQFYVLYDFSATIGDSWTVPGIVNNVGCDTVGTIQVDSIGTMTIDNQVLRYICVSAKDSIKHWGWNAKIVERIGPIKSFNYYNYLFPVKMDYCGLAADELTEGGTLRCYSDSTFNYSSNIAPSCGYVPTVNVSIENKLKTKKTRIFPNPANGFINIIFGESITEIQLTDLLGNIVFQKLTNRQTELKLENIKSGIYILTVKESENFTDRIKIINSN